MTDTNRLAALLRAVRDVLDKAEADDDFDGQFIDYLVPYGAIAALRSAYGPWASPLVNDDWTEFDEPEVPSGGPD